MARSRLARTRAISTMGGLCTKLWNAAWNNKYSKNPYKYFHEIRQFKPTFDKLHLTDLEIGKFYLLFLAIDTDGSMSVDISEVFLHLRIEKTYFNKRVFGLLDVDNSGALNFEEFVVGIWNYCTLTDSLFGTLYICLHFIIAYFLLISVFFSNS